MPLRSSNWPMKSTTGRPLRAGCTDSKRDASTACPATKIFSLSTPGTSSRTRLTCSP